MTYRSIVKFAKPFSRGNQQVRNKSRKKWTYFTYLPCNPDTILTIISGGASSRRQSIVKTDHGVKFFTISNDNNFVLRAVLSSEEQHACMR